MREVTLAGSTRSERQPNAAISSPRSWGTVLQSAMKVGGTATIVVEAGCGSRLCESRDEARGIEGGRVVTRGNVAAPLLTWLWAALVSGVLHQICTTALCAGVLSQRTPAHSHGALRRGRGYPCHRNGSYSDGQLPCHAGGRGFKSRPPRKESLSFSSRLRLFSFLAMACAVAASQVAALLVHQDGQRACFARCR